MTKHILSYIALTYLCLVGCSTLEEQNLANTGHTEIQTGSLSATMEENSTRTVSTNGRNTQWENGDAIVVGFSTAVSGSDKFLIYKTSDEKSNTAIFTTSNPSLASGKTMTYAVYGGMSISGESKTSNVVSINSESAQVTIPSTFVYADKNCNGAIMMGEVNNSDKTIAFKNAGATLYLKLGKEMPALSKIEVSTDIAINGTATVNWNNGEPTYSISGTEEANKKITIDMTGDATGSERIIVVPLPTGNYKYIQVDATATSEGATPQRIFENDAENGTFPIVRNHYYIVECNSLTSTVVAGEIGLRSALAEGGNYKLMNDITIVSPISINAAENATEDPNGYKHVVDLDLNGHKLIFGEKESVQSSIQIGFGKTDKIKVRIHGGELEWKETPKSAIIQIGSSGNIASNAEVELSNITIKEVENTEHSQVVCHVEGNGNTLNVNNCDFTVIGLYAVHVIGNTTTGNTINIADTKITNNDKATEENTFKTFHAVFVSNANENTEQTVTISNSEFKAEMPIEVQNSNLTVQNTWLETTSNTKSYESGNAGCCKGYCIAFSAISDNGTEVLAKGQLTLGAQIAATGTEGEDGYVAAHNDESKKNTYRLRNTSTDRAGVLIRNISNPSDDPKVIVNKYDDAEIKYDTPQE